MSKNGLHRMYDRLDAGERFRLDVLATARGDTQESERLARTCPRFNYAMSDQAYVERWTATYEITLRMYIALDNTLTKLQMVDAFRQLISYSETLMHNATFDAYFDGHLAGSYHAWNHAGKTGCPPAWPDDDLEPDEDERDSCHERLTNSWFSHREPFFVRAGSITMRSSGPGTRQRLPSPTTVHCS